MGIKTPEKIKDILSNFVTFGHVVTALLVVIPLVTWLVTQMFGTHSRLDVIEQVQIQAERHLNESITNLTQSQKDSETRLRESITALARNQQESDSKTREAIMQLDSRTRESDQTQIQTMRRLDDKISALLYSVLNHAYGQGQAMAAPPPPPNYSTPQKR